MIKKVIGYPECSNHSRITSGSRRGSSKSNFIRDKLWVISSIIFLSFLQTGCSAEVKDNPTDKLVEVQDPYSWDFGQVKEGEVLKHTFVLKNESEKTMTIKDVNTSCGCTLSKVKKKILLPVQSTAIEVQFNTKGYSGLTQQYVYVHTDSLDKPILRFIIKAEIIKNIQHSRDAFQLKEESVP